MNRPMPVFVHWLGHMACIAFFHNSMSDDVGCLFGHRIVGHASPQGWRDSTSELILFPDAVKMSDINNTCMDTRTLFSHQSSSAPYPARSNTCMMNWSPSLGNFRDLSGMITVISNIDNFSHSIFIHVCVTRKPNLISCSLPAAAGTTFLIQLGEGSRIFA